MSKTKRILLDVFTILLGIIFLVFGIRDFIKYYNSNTIKDYQIMKSDFQNISKDNYFKIITNKELSKNKENIIIIEGYKYDPLSQVLMPVLDKIAKLENIDIYYMENKDNIPNIYVYSKTQKKYEIKKDKLYDVEYKGAPIEYWNEDKSNKLHTDIIKIIEKYKIPKRNKMS